MCVCAFLCVCSFRAVAKANIRATQVVRLISLFLTGGKKLAGVDRVQV